MPTKTKVTVSVRLDPEVLEKIDLLAKETERDRSFTVNKLLKLALDEEGSEDE